jgi:hypothetical protein
LAGLTKNTDTSNISTAKLFLTFYDFADRELTSKIKVLDVDELFNARPLLPFHIDAKVSEYPPTTEKVTWKLEIGSVDQGDYVTIRTSVPSMTQTPFAGSQILSDLSRTEDNLNFAPSTPFELVEGAVVMSLAIGWDVAPTESKYLLDTRDSSSLDQGIALRVEADGNLTLLVQDSATTTSLATTTPPTWVFGAITEVVMEWSALAPLMRLSVDSAVVAEDTTTALPSGLEDLSISSVQLGSDAQANNHADSEYVRIVFLTRPR